MVAFHHFIFVYVACNVVFQSNDQNAPVPFEDDEVPAQVAGVQPEVLREDNAIALDPNVSVYTCLH